jgi:hypothetical protein
MLAVRQQTSTATMVSARAVVEMLICVICFTRSYTVLRTGNELSLCYMAETNRPEKRTLDTELALNRIPSLH